MQIKSTWRGPTIFKLAADQIALVIADRRVATKQRRARGDGSYDRAVAQRGGDTEGRALDGALEYGRRSFDKMNHAERRINMSVSNHLDVRWSKGLPCRRASDERRATFGPNHASSVDPRVRALERRNKAVVATPSLASELAGGTITFRRYTAVPLDASATPYAVMVRRSGKDRRVTPPILHPFRSDRRVGPPDRRSK